MKLILVICTFFLSTDLYAQIYYEHELYADTYDRQYVRRNRIKTISVVTTSGEKKWIRKHYFNSDGYQTSSTYSYKDTVRIEYKYIRNSLNAMVLRKRTSTELPHITDTFQYENGKLIRETMWVVTNSGNSKKLNVQHIPGEVRYMYNNAGQMIRSESTFSGATDYKYNSQGLLEETSRSNFTYDQDKTGTIYSKKFRTYIAGLLVKEDEVIIEDNGGSYEYTYDCAGRLLSIISTTSTTQHFTYDKRGLLSQVKLSLKPGHVLGDEIFYEFRESSESAINTATDN